MSFRTPEPSQQDMQAALSRLDEMARTAILGEIGGGRPNKESRAASWWGGNFLAATDEDVPICKMVGTKNAPSLADSR